MFVQNFIKLSAAVHEYYITCITVSLASREKKLGQK